VGPRPQPEIFGGDNRQVHAPSSLFHIATIVDWKGLDACAGARRPCSTAEPDSLPPYLRPSRVGGLVEPYSLFTYQFAD